MKRFLSVILALMMIFSTVISAAPSMVSTADTSAEAVEEVGANTEAVVLDEDTPAYDDEEKGWLVASVDFESATVGTTLANFAYASPAAAKYHSIDTVLGTVPKKVPAEYNMPKYLTFVHVAYDGVNPGTVIQGDDDNKYLEYTFEASVSAPQGVNVSSFQPHFAILSDNNRDGATNLFPEGEYTFEYDIEVDTTKTVNGSIINLFGAKRAYYWNFATGAMNKEGDVNEFTYPDGVNNTKHFVVKAYNTLSDTFSGYKGFAAAPQLSLSNTTTAKISIKVDNLKLYFKPFISVDVTFDNGGVDSELVVADGAEAPTDNVLNVPGTIDLSKYSYANTDKKAFKGWQDANGKALSGTINITENLTVTAVWEDIYVDNYGYLVASVDFENTTVGDQFYNLTYPAKGGTYYPIVSKGLGTIPNTVPSKYNMPTDLNFIHYGSTGYGYTATIKENADGKYFEYHFTPNFSDFGTSFSDAYTHFGIFIGDGLYANTGITEVFPEGEYTFMFDMEYTDNNGNTTLGSYKDVGRVWNAPRSYSIYTNAPKFTNAITYPSDNTTTHYEYKTNTADYTPNTVVAFAAAPQLKSKVATTAHDSTIKLDNFKLYFKPIITADVTFDSNDVDSTLYADGAAVDGNTVTVKGSLDLSKYKYANTATKYFRGWRDSEGKALTGTISVEEATTLVADWEDLYHDEYGALVATLDFDYATLGTEFKNRTYDGNAIYSIKDYNLGIVPGIVSGMPTNPLFMYRAAFHYENLPGNGVLGTIEGDGKNNYLTLSFDSPDGLYSGVRPLVMIAADNLTWNASNVFPEGEYTYVFDYEEDATRNVNSLNTPDHGGFGPQRNYLYTTKTAIDGSLYADGQAFDNIMPEEGSTQYIIRPHYTSASVISEGVTFISYKAFAAAPEVTAVEAGAYKNYKKIDNFKVYFKPYVEVTFDGGEDGVDFVIGDGAKRDLNANGNISVGEGTALNLADYSFTTADPALKAFSHWADAQGNALTTINPEENTTVYAVYKGGSNYATSYQQNELRVEDPVGIRFRASVTTTLRNNDNLTEYGFIVTRKALLEKASVNVNDFKHGSIAKIAEGKSFVKSDDPTVAKDLVFEQTDDNVFFTAVVYNIPATNYADDLVVRPYTIVDGEYYYGDPIVNNILNVAEKLKDSEYYEAYQDTIDKIIAGEKI